MLFSHLPITKKEALMQFTYSLLYFAPETINVMFLVDAEFRIVLASFGIVATFSQMSSPIF